MALAESVREIVLDTARANHAERVRTVRLEIGALSQVEPEAMRFAWDVVMQDGAAQGALLLIVITPGQAWCMQCSASVPVAQRGDACPQCGSHQLQVTGGDRMRVMDIEID